MQRTSDDKSSPIPSLGNAVIVLAQAAAVVGLLYLASRVHGILTMTGIAIAFGIVMNSVYSSIHEAEHAMLFANTRCNELAGAFLALLFPAPFHLLRQGHIGHHMRNRSDDEAFDLYFEGDNVVWRWLCWIGILTGVYYLLVVVSNFIAVVAPFIFDRKHFKVERHVGVDRASAAFLESFNSSYLAYIWIEGAMAIALHATIIWFFHIPILRYVAMYGTFGFMWSAMQYVHHYHTERHVTRGARNLFLFLPIDIIWLNHNWHRVHHEHPTVPWIHLPRLAQEEGAVQRGFLPWFYLKMWLGPKKTDEHVANRYAGRIIQ